MMTDKIERLRALAKDKLPDAKAINIAVSHQTLYGFPRKAMKDEFKDEVLHGSFAVVVEGNNLSRQWVLSRVIRATLEEALDAAIADVALVPTVPEGII